LLRKIRVAAAMAEAYADRRVDEPWRTGEPAIL